MPKAPPPKAPVDPAVRLADAAEAEVMYARDVIRFPSLLKKHRISPEAATQGTAHRADTLVRERIRALFQKYGVK